MRETRGKKKYLDYLIALLVLLTLNFILPRAMPGDPMTSIYGDAVVDMSPELEAALVEQYGFDKPVHEQLIIYLKNTFSGDFGYSYQHNAPVLEVIMDVFPWTLLLVGSSLVISTLLGIIIGIETAWRKGGKLDRFTLVFVMFLNGMPSFFVGNILLIILSFQLQLFPLSGAVSPYADYVGIYHLWDVLKHLFLPALTLVIVQLPRNYLLMRNAMLGVLREPYVRTARGKGLKERAVRYRHAARGALLPVLTRFGMSIGQLLTGVLFVEIVFAYPGIGHLFYQALQNHDYPLVQGALLLIAVTVLAANFLTDIAGEKIDPRLREDAY